ncbi:MAG: hypothetical protein GVY13_07525 [Alphaproteobacteria bacterium]|jgi:hypothetical protein|nr:hypothetical protein [Alphaproteobacteria bacterium]
MQFSNPNLSALLAEPQPDLAALAEQGNLCLEHRVSAGRQSAYEAFLGEPQSWADWRERHFLYVREEVRRRFPPSASFTAGEPSLRPGIEPNQYLLRVERIDSLLAKYTKQTGVKITVEEINRWIPGQRKSSSQKGKVSTLADLAAIQMGEPETPEAAALGELTDFFNQERNDCRPSFVAFAAEFDCLAKRGDWAEEFCRRCGLAHFFAGTPVTLALFRYRGQDVIDALSAEHGGAVVFAVPTTIDQPFYNVYFPAPADLSWGQAVGLAPESDCSHLAAELIHARIDYQPAFWVTVTTVDAAGFSDADITDLRARHLRCLQAE